MGLLVGTYPFNVPFAAIYGESLCILVIPSNVIHGVTTKFIISDVKVTR